MKVSLPAFNYTNIKGFLDRWLPAVFFVLGIFLLIIGKFFLNGDVASLAGQIGASILVGGVFTSIIKSYQFSVIFQAVMERIFFSSSLMLGLQEKQPTEVGKALKRELGRRIPLGETWYFDNHETTMYVSWKDKEKGIIIIESFVGFNAIKVREDIVFSYEVEFTQHNGASNTEIYYNTESLRIDGEKIERIKDESKLNEKNAVRERFEAPTGRLTHRIEEISKNTVSIYSDPYFAFAAKRYYLGMKIFIYFEVDDIDIFFVESGADDHFSPCDVPPAPRATIRGQGWSCPTLIFPDQGYTLIFRERG